MDPLKQINKITYANLQKALVHSVIAGGTASMEYYRQPLKEYPAESISKNPSTIADLHATLAIIYALDNYLSPITMTQFGCDFSCLAEETHYVDWFQNKLSAPLFQKIKTPKKFFSQTKGIRVIIDGIDGTGNFLRGIPLFCSAAAIIVDNHPRVSALYDPVQHIVYSACLPGPDNNIRQNAEAWEWHISNNHRTDLTLLNQGHEKKTLLQETIGVHFSRSDPNKMHELLQSNNSHSILEKLSRSSAGIYAFNSSFIAMIYVAQAALGAYVNNTTHLWDIAAGEVLVRACGGKVTDLNKNPIVYNSSSRLSVVAAREQLYDDLMHILLI
jgi:fructose-1,6-bisphosphatase/inositol monophosphatase family enzyme